MSPQERQNRLFNVAVCALPAFRDKYDFSEPSDYDKLAERCFQSAEAFLKKDEAMRKAIEEAQKKAEEIKQEVKK